MEWVHGDGQRETGIIVPKLCEITGIESWPQPSDEPQWLEVNGQSIPLFFNQKPAGPLYSINDNRLQFHVDWMTECFFWLSGAAEILHGTKDAMGRYKFAGSLIEKHQLTATPLVNLWFNILVDALKEMGHVLESKWNPSILLSHDIDVIHKGWKEDAFFAFKKGRVYDGVKALFNAISGGHWNNLKSMHHALMEEGIQSSYYFISEQGQHGPVENADYSLKEISEEFAYLKANGAEVGLHATNEAHLEEQSLLQQKEKIPGPVLGGRYHYLRYDPYLSPSVLQAVGLTYDSSVGFAEQIGFRSLCCTPYFLFDWKEIKTTNVLEFPLVIMDRSLAGRQYMNLSPEQAEKEAIALLTQWEYLKPAVGLLWHNNYFTGLKFGAWAKMFWRMVSALQSRFKIQSHQSFLNQP